MHIIFIILLFIFLLVAPVILFILRIAGRLFRTGSDRATGGNSQKRSWSSTFSRQKEQKKVFDKNEGEYVDFEEIKNNQN